MQQDFTLNAYDYHLPKQNIAQQPAEKRENSRLLVVDRKTSAISHTTFSNITNYLSSRDMVVLNDTKVFPARLFGKKETGGKAEIFLLGFPKPLPQAAHDGFQQSEVTALVKSSKRPKVESKIIINEHLYCIVKACLVDGKVRIILCHNTDLAKILDQTGQVPLPPYIDRKTGTTPEDRTRYQTVYANKPGAVAAPTAGLHFTDQILEQLKNQNIQVGTLTLHVGYGTFAPVRTEDITQHNIHHEYVSVSKELVEKIHRVKKAGGKIWAIGTTTVRALEFAAKQGSLQPVEGWCDLYILPGYDFKVIDHLLTNFHLPQSSLLFLVSALCGREKLLEYYQEAITAGYRFYSYGDAMLII